MTQSESRTINIHSFQTVDFVAYGCNQRDDQALSEFNNGNPLQVVDMEELIDSQTAEYAESQIRLADGGRRYRSRVFFCRSPHELQPAQNGREPICADVVYCLPKYCTSTASRPLTITSTTNLSPTDFSTQLSSSSTGITSQLSTSPAGFSTPLSPSTTPGTTSISESLSSSTQMSSTTDSSVTQTTTKDSGSPGGSNGNR